MSGAIASLPSTYQTQKEFENRTFETIVWLITIATFVNLSIKNIWSLGNMSDKVYVGLIDCYEKRTDPGSIARKRAFMRGYLQSSIHKLTNMPDDEISRFFTERQDSTIESGTIPISSINGDNVRDIFRLFASREEPRGQTLEKIAAAFGALIGALGAWYSYPLGKAGGEELLLAMGIGKQTAKFFSYFFGTAATVCNGSLLTYTTQDCFTKFYKLFSGMFQATAKKMQASCCHQASTEGGAVTDRSRLLGHNPLSTQSQRGRTTLRTVLSSLSFVVALCGGGAIAQMTYENINKETFYAPLIIACAFIGMFSSKFWAIKGIINIKLTKKEQMTLEGALIELRDLLPDLKDECLEELLSLVPEDQRDPSITPPTMV